MSKEKKPISKSKVALGVGAGILAGAAAGFAAGIPGMRSRHPMIDESGPAISARLM